MKNKENLKLNCYLVSVGLFSVLGALAFFNHVNRLRWLIMAFAFLGFGWLLERSFSRKRDLAVSEHKAETRQFETIEIYGTLTISDRMDLLDGAIIANLPNGTYSICVNMWTDRTDLYVAGITITGPPGWKSPLRQEVILTVDTGFLIFSGAEKSDGLLQRVKDAQSEILANGNRSVGAQVFAVGEKNVGIVTSTGYGDDQYLLKLEIGEGNRPVIICRFIDPGEMAYRE
jgi:hypothetical protein